MVEFKDTSIRKKLITIQVATAFTAVLICCVFFVYNDIKIYEETSLNNKYSIAEIVGVNAASSLEFMDQDAANTMLRKLKSNPDILNAAIFDKKGKKFARYNKPGEETFSFPAPGDKEMRSHERLGQNFLVSYRIMDKDFLGTVMLRGEYSGFNQIIFSYIKIAALILLTSLAGAFIISTFFQRSVTSRLLALVNKTKEVAKTGNYSIRASAGGHDEIGTLTGAFNNMLEQIEKMENYMSETNIELEKRVKIRTVELEKINKEVQKKSDELTFANKELEQFAYVASHDLQEPLRTISNFVTLFEEEYNGKLDKEADQYLRFIVSAVSKMQYLIKDLLELSRIGRNMTFISVDCNKILEEVVAEMEGSIKESHAQITSDRLPVLMGIETGLRMLFQNLISNAIKFRKKDIALEIDISVKEKSNEYLFAFQDNGIGIEEQFKDRIFIIFQRLHNASEYPGTGIGLATCKKIVTLHNGNIWVESAIGKGSVFYFTLSKENLN